MKLALFHEIPVSVPFAREKEGPEFKNTIELMGKCVIPEFEK